MQLVAPDILAEAVGLSPAFPIVGGILGVLLWLHGWRAHRFWVVLLATVSAGVFGLSRGADYGSQPLLAGILLALAFGMLALALVRVVAFVAGGMGLFFLVRAVAPSMYEPLVWFLVGGLLGLVLFRVWVMALTAFAGSLIALHSGLCCADLWGKMEAVSWAEDHAVLLNWICAVLTLSGLLVQIGLERRRARKQKEAEEQALKEEQEKQRRLEPPPPPPRTWWGWFGDVLRKAG
jgi:MFS family permease